MTTTAPPPLKFLGWMIPLIQAGTKTQTRRLIEPQPDPLIDADRALRLTGAFWQDRELHCCPYSAGDVVEILDADTPEAPPVCRVRIADVRAQQVQEITEEDARAEGILDGGCLNCGNPEPCLCSEPQSDARDAFAWLWQSIYGPDAWHLNRWAWVLTIEQEPVASGDAPEAVAALDRSCATTDEDRRLPDA
jgi:hypothetical protein